jgi:diamine N-acetyltransferase
MAIVRRAEQSDLATIMRIERIPEFRSLVGSWSEAEHIQTFTDPDAAYWVSTDRRDDVEGFCIVRGLCSEHKSVELKRIAVANPNEGIGKRLLIAVCKTLFAEHGTHRIWLDVFERNDRARSVYRSVGFREDGLLREAIYRDGVYHSLVLMSVLNREFLPPQIIE